MDTLLAAYGIDQDVLLPFLRRESVLLAGSAALALYLEQEGKEGFDPADLDLWVSGMDQETEEELVVTLRQMGFSVTGVEKELDQYMERLTRIQQVMTLESDISRTHQKKIQVIRVVAEDLKEYVASQFDLSACMSWWCSEAERFTTLYPALTHNRKMFVRHSFISQMESVRMTERLEKYKRRGFEVVTEPPPFWNKPDERSEEDLRAWEGVSAFDVLAYDDVSVMDHLRAGAWNILLGCGDAWYAFERRALICYMRDHKQIHGVDRGRVTLYETPFRQCVGHDAWDSLAYSDDSVYRLVEGETHGTKTVYTMETYSLQDWRAGIPSQSWSPFGLMELDPFEGLEGMEGVEGLDVEYIEERELQEILSEELSVPLSAPVALSDNQPYRDDELYQQILSWINAYPEI